MDLITAAPDAAPAAAAEQMLPDAALRKAKRILERASEQSTRDKKDYDKFVKQYRSGVMKSEVMNSQTAGWISANQVFGYINVLLSLLYHQNPSIEVVPRTDSGASEQQAQVLVDNKIYESIDDVREGFAETLRAVLTYTQEEGNSQIQNNACLFECLVRGLGWTKSGFDPVRGIDRCDALRRDEIYVDPHARNDPNQARYIVQICILPIDEARELFTALEYQGEIAANYQLSEGTGLESEKAKENDPATEKDCFKFFEMWSKEGAGRFVDYFDASTKQHLMRRPWPFILDYDEFPFEALSFNQQYTQVCDAFPDLQVVESLFRLYEYLIEYFHRHVRRSIAKKVVYDGDTFSEDQVEFLKDAQDLRFVKADRLNGRDIKSAIQIVDFNSTVDTAADLAKSVKQIAEQILGLDEIQKGGMAAQKEITATHAEILDDYGRLRLGRKQKIVDEWLQRQTRHRAQIARQLISPEKVAKIAGQKAAVTWGTLAYEPEDLIGEYTIGIVAGSAGERAKREKLRRHNSIFERMKEGNALAGADVFDLVKMVRQMIRDEGENKPEKYENPPDQTEQPKAQEQFNINGAAVDGLYKLIAPPQGGEPLISWDEGRQVVAASIGVDPASFHPVPVAPQIPVDVNVNATPQQGGFPR